MPELKPCNKKKSQICETRACKWNINNFRIFNIILSASNCLPSMTNFYKLITGCTTQIENRKYPKIIMSWVKFLVKEGMIEENICQSSLCA